MGEVFGARAAAGDKRLLEDQIRQSGQAHIDEILRANERHCLQVLELEVCVRTEHRVLDSACVRRQLIVDGPLLKGHQDCKQTCNRLLSLGAPLLVDSIWADHLDVARVDTLWV